MSDATVKADGGIELGCVGVTAVQADAAKDVSLGPATIHLPHLANEHGPKTLPDAAKTRGILAKLDQRIVPITVLLYGTSFIDRAAIGYARTVGLMSDLHLTDEQYALDVSIFFVAYVLFGESHDAGKPWQSYLSSLYTRNMTTDVPSNIGLRYFGARRWLSGVALCWGVCQLCTAFVRSHAQLAVVRTLMGIFESGILPGITTAMSFVYPASTIQSRFGALVALNVLFGVFAGLLAYAIAHGESCQASAKACRSRKLTR